MAKGRIAYFCLYCHNQNQSTFERIFAFFCDFCGLCDVDFINSKVGEMGVQGVFDYPPFMIFVKSLQFQF